MIADDTAILTFDSPTPHEDSAAMRYENFGPVANPDGTPTDVTRAMLAGTGREAFAASAAVSREPTHFVHDGSQWVPCDECDDFLGEADEDDQ